MPPDPRRASLHRDIKILSGIMLQKRLFEEANWLWMAFGSPDACQSEVVRVHLRHAVAIARENRFGAVANWIEEQILSRPF